MSLAHKLVDKLRDYKVTYALYNLLHKHQLSHNPPLYKKYGLKKKYYSSISSKDFAHLDVPDLSADINGLKQSNVYAALSEEDRKSIDAFHESGYLILRGFYNIDQVQLANDAVEQKLDSGDLDFRYGVKKIMFSHRHVPAVNALATDVRLLTILRYLLDGTPHHFQSISFPRKGSEQRMHTDSIHLSTYPKGGMVGVWIANEKIDHDNGPIVYIPGSHKLPYKWNASYHNEGTKYSIGDQPYTVYEDMIESYVANQLQDHHHQYFYAEPGDVLIWHANLLHAGSPHHDDARTRKSTVFHYLSDQCIWYHEITQRPILFQ